MGRHNFFPLGDGIPGEVYALAWYNGQLYAAGNFTMNIDGKECI